MRDESSAPRAEADEVPGFSRDRLSWLIGLRWFAMSGVFAVFLAAASGLIQGPSLTLLGLVLFIGIFANILFQRALPKKSGASLRAPLAHAALDLSLLTMVLWATGWVMWPFLGFYLFHVVLMATLGGPRATVITALMTLAFATALGLLNQLNFLRVAVWEPEPHIALISELLGFIVLLAGVTYLVAHAAAELRTQERALSEAKERAAREERKLLLAERLASLGRVSQGVAHELNTPLATIRTLATDMREALSFLREGHDDPTATELIIDDLDESAVLIRDETTRMGKVTQSLLKGGDLVEIQIRDGVVLYEVAERSRSLVIAGRRSKVRVELEPSLRGHVLETDADRLLQIIVNLTQNAVDAVREEGSYVRIHAEDLGENVAIFVDDDGPGLSEDMRSRLFEPFATTKPVGEGTGLGLYTSHLLAETLGGSLELEAREPRGVRAELRLPKIARREVEDEEAMQGAPNGQTHLETR